MKIFLDSIGCRLNQSEIEKYASEFIACGHELVSTMETADLAVLNTCAVTAAAASDSRQRLHRLLNHQNLKVIATGCLTEIEPKLLSNLSGDIQFIPNLNKDELVRYVLGSVPSEHPAIRVSVPGRRQRTRAFIKAQDGCNNHCTFCVTRIARGTARSIPVTDICADVRSALASGVKEIVLTGVHLGCWGVEYSPPQHLSDLLQHILTISGDFRIRLSSLEPWDLTPDFFCLWQDDDRLCRHFHLPLQSGSAATLKRMARNTTPDAYRELMQEIRRLVPGVSISTDVIVGFPGENEIEFKESLKFISEMGFAAGHVFHFSPREGTPAARLPNQVAETDKKARSRLMRAVLARSGCEIRTGMLNTIVPVLWEGLRQLAEGKWQVAGLTHNNFRVRTIVSEKINNRLLSTRLDSLSEDGFIGSVILPGKQARR